MRVKVNVLPFFEDEIIEIAKKVIKKEKIKGEISITIVDDEYMKELNRNYKNKNRTTDVVSFYYKENEKFKTIGGDIYISIEQASRQKKRNLLKELKLLVIHGLLHLAGYNDTTKKERKIMRKKEREYL
uniref:Endoribonuclease YbeY n=1 Tax=candidate division WOR-3 bacterium TaxID=2052148 RepID=A0A7C4Y9R6_UNCW3